MDLKRRLVVVTNDDEKVEGTRKFIKDLIMMQLFKPDEITWLKDPTREECAFFYTELGKQVKADKQNKQLLFNYIGGQAKEYRGKIYLTYGSNPASDFHPLEDVLDSFRVNNHAYILNIFDVDRIVTGV